MEKKNYWYGEGVLNLCLSGSYNEAIDWLEERVGDTTNTADPEAALLLATIHGQLGNNEDALWYLELAEKDCSAEKRGVVYFNKGLIYLRIKDYNRSLYYFSLAETHSQKDGYAMASVKKGEIYLALDQNIKALACFDKAEKDGRNHILPQASLGKGRAHLALRNLEAAIVSFDKAEKDSKNEKFPPASCEKGMTLYTLGKLHEALESFQKAVADARDRKYPEASYGIGLVLKELERYEEAIVSWKKAAADSKGGKYPEASFQCGTALQLLGRYAAAIGAYSKAEEDMPQGKFPKASYRKGRCFMFLKQPQEALSSFNKAEKDADNQGFPRASLQKGKLHKAAGAYEKAIASFQKAKRDTKEGVFPEACYYLGNCFLELGEYQKAIEQYSRAERDSPALRYPKASFKKGCAFEEMGQLEHAVSCFDKAQSDMERGNYISASRRKAYALFELGRYEEAIGPFTIGLEDPDLLNQGKCHLGLSYCYYYLKEQDRAKKHGFEAYCKATNDPYVVGHVIEHLGSNNGRPWYENRLKYIQLMHHKTVDGLLELFLEGDGNPSIGHKLSEDRRLQLLFERLLMDKTVRFSNEINFKERLQLCYLVHLKNQRFHEAHYILGELKIEVGHDCMDRLLYSVCSYAIATPIIRIKDTGNIELPWIQGAHKKWKHHLQETVGQRSPEPIGIKPVVLEELLSNCTMPDSYHPWVQEVFTSLQEQSGYSIPLSKTDLQGLEGNAIQSRLKTLNSIAVKNRMWSHLQESLEGIADGETAHRFVLDAIRQGITKGVSFRNFLLHILQLYYANPLKKIRRGLILLATASMVSLVVDKKKKFFMLEPALREILTVLEEEGLLGYLDDSDVLGLGKALRCFSSLGKGLRELEKQERNKMLFDRIAHQIEALG